eukprot:802739-Pyramimonas_sp.AAC.1
MRRSFEKGPKELAKWIIDRTEQTPTQFAPIVFGGFKTGFGYRKGLPISFGALSGGRSEQIPNVG